MNMSGETVDAAAKTRDSAKNAHTRVVQIVIQETSVLRIIGSVMLRNCAKEAAPSIVAAS